MRVRSRSVTAVAAGFAVMAAMGWSGAPAQAETTTDLVAVADTYVNKTAPSTAYGSGATLIGNANDGWTKRVFTKFDTSSITAPVTKAELVLKRDPSINFPGTLTASPVADVQWQEGGLTWNNQPAAAAPVATVTPGATDGTVTFDVTAAVQSGQSVALRIDSASTTSPLRVLSKEGGTAPILRITTGTSTPPPPSQTCAEVVTFDEALVPSCGALWGVAANAFGTDQGPVAHRRHEQMSGRKVGVYHYYYRGDTLFPRASDIELLREPGKERVLFANWKVADGTTWKGVADGAVNARIDRLAAHLKANFTERFFLTIHHEPEDDVNQTAGSGMTANDYRNMFRHTVQRLRAQGVTNAVYVMNYMAYSNWVVQAWFPALYPGDDVVDWVAWDPYGSSPASWDLRRLLNETNGKKFADGTAYQGAYNYFTAMHPGKPLMLAEWGLWRKKDENPATSSTAPFFRSIPGQLDEFPSLKAMVYFENYGPSTATATEQDRKTSIDVDPNILAAWQELSADPRLVNYSSATTPPPPPPPANVVPVARVSSQVSDMTVALDGAGSSDSDGQVVDYAWSFGDGSTGSGVSVSHEYADAGTYEVSLTVTDDRGGKDMVTKSVTVVRPNVVPVARVSSQVSDLTVALDGAGSSDSDGQVVDYAWSFGDGSTGSGVSVSHEYADAGTYGVSLTVTDDRGGKDTVTKSVTVVRPNVVPVARVSSQVSDLTVALDGAGSSDSDGQVVDYAWSFGDGSTGSGVSVSHEYADAGTYEVSLTVTDDRGGKDTVTKSVSVVRPNVVPVARVSSQVSDLTVALDGAGSSDSDGQVVDYAWSFGDGSTGSGVSVSHEYADAGTFEVSLTVTDDRGGKDTVTKSVTVVKPLVVAAVDGSNANTNAATVTVPAAVRAGDQLVLMVARNSLTTGSTLGGVQDPAGLGSWQLRENTNNENQMGVLVYTRTAEAADAGKTITVTSDIIRKIDLRLVAVRNGSVANVAVNQQKSVTNLVAPDPTATARDSVSAWFTKSAAVTRISAPTGASVLSTGSGSGSGRLNSLVARLGSGRVAVADAQAGRATSITLSLR